MSHPLGRRRVLGWRARGRMVAGVTLQLAVLAQRDQPVRAGQREVVVGEVAGIGQHGPDLEAQVGGGLLGGPQGRFEAVGVVGVLTHVDAHHEVVVGDRDLGVVALYRSAAGAVGH